MNDGVTLNGRALARNGAVTLINDTITAPHCATAAGRRGRRAGRRPRAAGRRGRRRQPAACGRTTSSSRRSSTPASTRRARPGPARSGRGRQWTRAQWTRAQWTRAQWTRAQWTRRASARRGRARPGPARRARSDELPHRGRPAFAPEAEPSIEPVWWLSAVIGAVAVALYLLLGPPLRGDPGPRDRLVGARPHGARHRALAGRAGVPAQHALVLADRHPADARARLRDRHARLLRRAGRLARRAAAAPAAAGQVRLQPRAVRARDGRADRRRAPGRLRRPGLRVDHVGRRARRDPDRRRADDRADPRRDGADRGPRLARSGAPDVRHGPRGHDHRHGDGARLRHPLDRAARGDAAAADPDPDRLRRLPRVRQGAPGPREGAVPLRGQPHPVRVARGRRRARGPARAGARGLPRRAGRGHPLRRRRRRAAAHQPRPGQRPRGDGARRRRGSRRAARVRRRAPTPRWR